MFGAGDRELVTSSQESRADDTPPDVASDWSGSEDAHPSNLTLSGCLRGSTGVRYHCDWVIRKHKPHWSLPVGRPPQAHTPEKTTVFKNVKEMISAWCIGPPGQLG